MTEHRIIKDLLDWLKYCSWKHNYDFIMRHCTEPRIIQRTDILTTWAIKFSLCDSAYNEYYNITYTQKQLIEQTIFNFD